MNVLQDLWQLKEMTWLRSRWRMFRLAGRPVFPGGPGGYSRESTPDGGAHYMETYRDVNGKCFLECPRIMMSFSSFNTCAQVAQEHMKPLLFCNIKNRI